MNELKDLIPAENLIFQEVSRSSTNNVHKTNYLVIGGLVIGIVLLSIYLEHRVIERIRARKTKVDDKGVGSSDPEVIA
jgi:hypothetical protein